MTDLASLGWDEALATAAAAHDPAWLPARITVAHRGAYELIAAAGPAWAELRGKDYFEARDKRALPTVGDWVMVQMAGELAVIEAMLPRRSVLLRAAAGEKVEPQPIAANVDVAFVVTSANLDLNPRRIERYLAAAEAGGVTAVIVVNKVDLVDDAAPVLEQVATVAGGRDVIAASATRGDGVDALVARLGRGRTGVLIGSSGVGKSTLLNQLLGRAQQDVQPVRGDDDRGRHTTTRRELFVLDGGAGGVVIDTPGMRELKPWAQDDAGEGDDAIRAGFEDIAELAAQCKFQDCTHAHEPGCAVRDAIAPDRLASWQKLQREQASEHGRRDEAARREERRRGKVMSRALRSRLKDKGVKD